MSSVANDKPRWTLGPNHRDYGFTPNDWRPAPPPRPRGNPTGARLKPGQWARHYDRCQDCGTTDRKHAGRGYGFCCYFRHLGEFAAATTAAEQRTDEVA